MIRVARDAAECGLVELIAEGIAAAPEIAAHSRRARQPGAAGASGQNGEIPDDEVEDPTVGDSVQRADDGGRDSTGQSSRQREG